MIPEPFPVAYQLSHQMARAVLLASLLIGAGVAWFVAGKQSCSAKCAHEGEAK